MITRGGFLLDANAIVSFQYRLRRQLDMSNSTASDQSSPESNVGMTVLSRLLPIAIAIILCNGLVFVLFCRKKCLRTSSNYLLLGLAICDFLTGAVNIPYFVIFHFPVVPPSMRADFNYWLFIVHTLTAVSAAYHLFIITAEKYSAIIRPLRHYLVTKKMVFKVLAVIWILSTLIGITPLIWKNSQSLPLCFAIYSIVCLVLVFVIPYTFMIYAYIVMFKAITSKRRPSSSHRGVTSRQRRRRTSDRKCILVFALMAAIFAICWLPYFTIMTVLNIKGYLRIRIELTPPIAKAAEVFAFVRYITSVVNPLLYTFFKRDFSRALISILFKSNNRTNLASRQSFLRHRSVTSVQSRLSWTRESSEREKHSVNANLLEEQQVFVSSV